MLICDLIRKRKTIRVVLVFFFMRGNLALYGGNHTNKYTRISPHPTRKPNSDGRFPWGNHTLISFLSWEIPLLSQISERNSYHFSVSSCMIYYYKSLTNILIVQYLVEATESMRESQHLQTDKDQSYPAFIFNSLKIQVPYNKQLACIQ